MNPIKLFKLFRDYEKFNSLIKEGPMTPKTLTQITALLVQVLGSFGAADAVQPHLGHLAWLGWLIAAINSVLAIGHALAPSLIPAPIASIPDSAKKAAGLLLLGLLLIPATLKAQVIPEAPAPQVQNLYAGGVSYSVGATPAIAGTGLYAHAVSSEGLYAFSVVDALPNTIKPFTVSTNVGVGIAQRLFRLGSVPIYAPTAAGISWNGGNTGWQWNGGVLASIHIRGNYYILPSVRFLKSSVSGGSGYQPIIGVLFGWGK